MTNRRLIIQKTSRAVLSIGMALLMLSCSRSANAPDASSTNQPPTCPALEQLLGPVLMDRQGGTFPTGDLHGKLIGLYFAAQWDPPSCYFTPRLVEFYERMKQDGKSFEVVLISDDRSSRDMMSHLNELNMPWPSVPFLDGSHQLRLKQLYGVMNLPVLIVLDDAGPVITTDGRADVMRKKEKAYEVWR